MTVRLKHYLLYITLLLTFSRPSPAQNIDLRTEDTRALIDSLNTRAASYRYSNLDSMNFYAQKAYDLALNTEHTSGLVESSRILVISMLIKGDYVAVTEFLYDIKLKVENTSFVKEKAILDHYLGIAFNTSGNYRAGLPYLLDALEVFRPLDNTDYILRSLNNIGVCYIRMKQFEDALKIFQEIESFVHEPDPGTITTLAVNLAYCYYGVGDYEKAETALLDFFALPKDRINERGYGFAYFKLGEVYLKQGDLQKAIQAFNSSLTTFDQFESMNDKVEPLVGLARVYRLTRDYQAANDQADQALDIAKAYGNLDNQKLALRTSYEIHKDEGDYKKALQIHEAYKAVVDSLAATRQTAEMGRISAQYEFNQQRNALILEQKEKELESQRVLSNQKLAIDITLTVIIAIVILLFFIYRSYTIKAKSNRLLTEKNKQIEIQRDQLEQSNRIKNKLFSIIAHDLRSPINTLDGLLHLVRNKMANNEDLKTVLPQLIKSFDHSSDILNNLLNWATGQMEGYTLELRSFNIRELLKAVVKNHKVRLDEKGIAYSIEGEDVQVHAEPDMIRIVCRNLLNNAIKYCGSGDHITIKIEVDQWVGIKVEDTGAGMSGNKVDALLNENTFSSMRGTDNEKGSGLGLMICKDLLIKNKSKLEISSTEGEGSTFSFYLPKSS
ncbi:MAG: tetratricopeptide repeat-containing sensor histidine kinase [Bacteroidota bacterium]